MESEDKKVEQLEKVLETTDEWLVKFGYIPNHAHNRVIEQLSLNLNRITPGDIDYLVDLENRRVDLTLYLPIWYLFYMFIFRKTDNYIFDAIRIVEEILSGYEIRASVARKSRQESDRNKVNSKPAESLEES